MNSTYDERLVSDFYKAVHRVRPSESWWAVWNSATPEVKQGIWDLLLVHMDIEHKTHQRAMALSKAKFEEKVKHWRDTAGLSRAEAICAVVEALPYTSTLRGHAPSFIAGGACYELDLDSVYISVIAGALFEANSVLVGDTFK